MSTSLANAPVTGKTTVAPLFDKGFVVGALLIGTVYCLVVVALAALVGKEAAGVGGVALSTLAVAIFKEFETLQFKKTDPRRVVPVPALSGSYVAVVSFAFAGVQILAGMLLGTAVGSAGLFSTGGLEHESVLALLASEGIHVSLVVLTLMSHIVAGILVARVSLYVPGVTYTYVALGSLLSSGLNVIPVFGMALATRSTAPLRGLIGPTYAFWLLYIAASLLAARLALRGRSTPPGMQLAPQQ